MIVENSAATIRSKRGRQVAFYISTALFSGLPSFALAQIAPPPALQSTPVFSTIDENGVDVVRGRFELQLPVLASGPPSDAVTMAYSTASGKMRADTYAGYVIANYQSPIITVNLYGDSETFTTSGWPSGIITSNQNEGSKLEIVMGPNGSVANGVARYIYTKSDGTVAIFEVSKYPNGIAFNPPVNAAIVSLRRPNGDTETFTYKTQSYSAATPNGTITGVVVSRTQSVVNNRGYMIKYEYPTGEPRNYPSAVTAINLGVDYCDPAADTCTTTQSWPRVQIGRTILSDGSAGLASLTDPLNRVVNISYVPSGPAAGMISAVKRPGSSTNNLTISYNTAGFVSNVTRDGVSYTYSYAISGDTATMTRTDPAGGTRVVTSSLSVGRPLSVRDELNRVTSYAYDSSGRLSQLTFPEGNSVRYTYDGRGNVTQVRRVAKAGSGLADIVTSASYPATCTNVVTCNRPTTTTDAKGNVTDYTYDPAHGGVLTVTAPAATTGATRPQTRYNYGSLQAYFRNSAGSIVASGQSVVRPTAISTCQSTASCVGTADESRTSIGYGPQTPGTMNNLGPVSVTRGSGDGALSVTTTSSYDFVGNVVSIDGPLAGSADTTVMRFDAARQLIGIMGPDPDGSGPLPNIARRMTYNLDGQLTKLEIGTTAGQSAAAFAAFSLAQQVTSAYDQNARKVSDTLQSGSTNFSLTQYSYDNKGRLDCVALRMNSAVYGSLPGACTASAIDPVMGPDRISKRVYNAADQVLKVQTALGTGDQADEVTVSYNGNSTPAAVADGLGNLTTYIYDGFDRLSQMRYPSASNGSVSSTTDFEQFSYDANGNVTSQRLRDGNTRSFAYDNLNRPVSKSENGTIARQYGYDLLGRLTSASWSGGSSLESRSYDALGRLIQNTVPWDSFSYQYDAAGNRTRMAFADGFFVTYSYNAASQLTAVHENGATSGVGVLASYGYDSLGRRSLVTRGNGTVSGYSYDPVGRLSCITIDVAGGGAVNCAPTASGNDQAATFAYNPAGQIISTTRANDTYAWTGHYNVNRSYTTNGLNQVTTAGSVALGYDGRGNLTSAGSTIYGYDLSNRLTSASGTVPYLEYGALDSLQGYNTASNVTVRFAYDGTDLVSEFTGVVGGGSASRSRRNVFAPGIDEPIVIYEGAGTTNRQFLASDERGSVVNVTNSTGSTVAINRYDEYGIPQGGNAGRFQYTGQIWIAELGMYHYKSRVYSPTLGRFLQTDPSGFADGMNIYNYVGGDPINLRDPLGLEGSEVRPPNGMPLSFTDQVGNVFQWNNVTVGGEPTSAGYTWSFNATIAVNFLSGFGFAPPTFAVGFTPSNSGPAATPVGRSFSSAEIDAAKTQNKQSDRPKCISPTDGPVDFTGGGLDLVLGAGGGFGVYKFSIPSTGAEGWVASGGFLGGAGAFFGGSKGRVDNFGNFTGYGWRGDFATPIPAVGGEVILGDKGNLAGGAASVGAGGGYYGGRTKTRVLSSNIPVCP